eukprot:1725385-Amphidinium_carterae.1
MLIPGTEYLAQRLNRLVQHVKGLGSLTTAIGPGIGPVSLHLYCLARQQAGVNINAHVLNSLNHHASGHTSQQQFILDAMRLMRLTQKEGNTKPWHMPVGPAQSGLSKCCHFRTTANATCYARVYDDTTWSFGWNSVVPAVQRSME